VNVKQFGELKLLAEKLPLVPEEKFRMGTWGRGFLQIDKPGFDCVFAGCAIGWAPKLIPDCGLGTVMVCSDSVIRHVPTFNGHKSYWAISAYFGISFDEACYLFDPYEYYSSKPTTEEVSGRILELLLEKEVDQ
jgi:hypothetical protein